MVDKSYCPCKICNHPQKDHNKNWAYCNSCGIRQYKESNPTSMHSFQRPDNLDYLEWANNQNERKA